MSALANIVDRTLEAAVVPSFTRVGPAVRRRLDHWESLDGLDLTGRVVVITGATSGLGRAAAERLAAMGATVEVVARDPSRVAPSFGSVRADLGDLDQVVEAAAELRRRHARIDVLVHNAGALDATRGTSPQGIEQTVASQVVGPLRLTAELLDPLSAASPGRVIWMSSGGMYSEPLDVEHLEMTAADYRGTTAYARAKRAQVTLAELLADRLADRGIVVHAMHPGWADTPGVEQSLPTFRTVVGPLLRTPEEGADTLVWLCASDGEPARTTGRFWLDRRPRPIHRLGRTRRSDTPEERARLWTWVTERAGLAGYQSWSV